jgi:voltage-gated potassium channel
VLRDNEGVLTPDDTFVLAPGDQLLLAGWPAARRALDATMVVDSTMEYVLFGRYVPSGWMWRRLARRPPTSRANIRPTAR